MARYTERELRVAVSESFSYAETLRKLGLCQTGGNNKTMKIWLAKWQIDISHFDPGRIRNAKLALHHVARPLDEVLVEDGRYARSHLKRRLFESGLKQKVCELCGQDENWRGKKMPMILDHINGKRDDNRIENLRILCHNCDSVQSTYCGRKNRQKKTAGGQLGLRPLARKVERPSHEQLLSELEAGSYVAVGRKYGVSDNAVRKWIRMYEKYLPA